MLVIEKLILQLFNLTMSNTKKIFTLVNSTINPTMSPIHNKNNDSIDNSFDDNQNNDKMNPIYKQRIDKQNTALDIIDNKLNILGENSSIIKNKLIDTTTDLSLLDDDVENNITQVNRTNVITEQILKRKDCLCGLGYWPIIVFLVISFLLGITVLVLII